MKDAILLFALLLNARTAKVLSLPYQADSNGRCHNPKTEYALDDGSNLCCSRCPPGQRQIKQCTNTTDSECEPCSKGLYIESWNYSPNCFACLKCKGTKGLQETQTCTGSINSKCVCQAGMYCIMGFDDPSCTDCKKYMLCKPGFGVSIPGKANSNVKCAPCPDGTFSNTSSFTDTCQPHTNCEGRAVVEKGNTTSDTVCEPVTLSHTVLPQSTTNEPLVSFVSTTASPVTTTIPTSLDSRFSTKSLVPESILNQPTKKQSPPADITQVSVILGVIGLLLLFIVMLVLLVRCKAIQKKEAERFDPKMDANGNCKRDDNTNQDCSVDTQLTSFTVNSPEQQCLLEAGEACSSLSQSINDAETLVRMEDCSSQECESIGPLQSTIAIHNPHSALSEPMPLLTNTEPISSQPNISPQSPSQPTSPQLFNPVAASPQVNVNITFHIGNGPHGTPPIIPTDSVKIDPDLPVGQEEECFSIPQQEAGKSPLMAVQESVSCNG